MATYYQLVELTSANVADDFDTLAEATEALRRAVQTYGADAMRSYSLLEVVNGDASLVAMEDELLELVARDAGQPATGLVGSART